MTPVAEAKLLRIVVSETYKVEYKPLYEAIVQAALTADLAGATVWRGMLSYGHDKRVHTAKILHCQRSCLSSSKLWMRIQKLIRFCRLSLTCSKKASAEG